jgi:hypothetical protein
METYNIGYDENVTYSVEKPYYLIDYLRIFHPYGDATIIQPVKSCKC